MAADLYLPKNFDKNKKYSSIITVHPIGSCKEQTSGNVYGQALSDAGFIALAIDASYQGESGGELRFMENPYERVEDIRAAVDYLVTLNYVDEDKIGILGVCGGGGYSLNAAMTERRIKAVTSITGVNLGRLIREGFAGGTPLEILEAISKQRTAEVKGAEILVNDLLPNSVEEAKQAGITDIDVIEATDYYKTSRGQKPNGATSAIYSRLGVAVGWDAFYLSETLLTQPLLVVVGDKPGAFGAYRDGHDIIRQSASTNKELVVIKDTCHYDLYDKEEAVSQALEKVIPFFKENLI